MNVRNTALFGLLLAGTLGLSQAVLADSTVLYNAEGQPVQSGTGGCVDTGDWNKSMPTCPEPTVVVKDHHVMVILSLADSEFFGFNKATLTADAKAKLDTMAAAIKDASRIDGIRIVGHADRIGPPPYNVELAMRRAQAVKRYLIGKGIPGKLIETLSDGQANPLVTCPGIKNQTKLIQCLAPNRRTDVQAVLNDKVNVEDIVISPPHT